MGCSGFEITRAPPAFFRGKLCIVGVTFPQPQGAQFGVHLSGPLLDVFSQETNLAPRKRGLFLVCRASFLCAELRRGLSMLPGHCTGVHWRSAPMVRGPA